MGENVSRIIVFMYHALYAGERELEQITPVDRPYAVSVRNFERQLDHLLTTGLSVLSATDMASGTLPEQGVLLTFDDGHASAYWHAAPRLRERGLGAIFFVTSDFIDRRSGFCSWPQLAQMARQGLSVQCHGKTHRFFDDLTDGQARAELLEARAAIEASTGRPVEAISFPGGRYRRRHLGLGRAAGYRWFFTSQAGANDAATFRAGAPIRRIPVKGHTDLATFRRLAAADRTVLTRASVTVSLKGIARRLVGNRIYQRLSERPSF
jgi:peptidoglycan/xylan/chitin deacetylase (PgdA/CDA1 family)